MPDTDLYDDYYDEYEDFEDIGSSEPDYPVESEKESFAQSLGKAITVGAIAVLLSKSNLYENARKEFDSINKNIWKEVWKEAGAQTSYEQGVIQTQIGVSGPVPVMEKYAQKYYKEHGLELVKTLSDTDIERFRTFAQNPANWNIPAEEFASRLDDSWAISEDRAAMIYENELHEAYVNGQYDYIDEEIIPMGRKVMKTFHHSGNPHPREHHLEIDGETTDYESNYSNGVEGPGGPNCGCWESFEVLPED